MPRCSDRLILGSDPLPGLAVHGQAIDARPLDLAYLGLAADRVRAEGRPRLTFCAILRQMGLAPRKQLGGFYLTKRILTSPIPELRNRGVTIRSRLGALSAFRV